MRKKILRAVLRFLAVAAASILLLAVLVWIPLRTHRPAGAESDSTILSGSEDEGLRRRPDAVGMPQKYADEPSPAQNGGETPGAEASSLDTHASGDDADPAEGEEEQDVFAFPDPDQPIDDPELQSLLDAFVQEHPGCWDICVYDLSGGSHAAVNTAGGKPMVSASLIKLFIMGSFYQAMTDGTLESWQYWNTQPSVRSMIVNSDNYCANWVIQSPLGKGSDSVGFEYVTAFAESIGCQSTRLERLMLADNSERENYTSAEDCARLLKMIYRCELISPEYSNEMLEILKAQAINDRLPAKLPEGTVCAHKTGDLEHLSCGDVGLIFSPGADYILCIINNHSENDAETAGLIADLSAEVYAHFNPPGSEEPEEPELSEG